MSESLPKHKFLSPPRRTLFILEQTNGLIWEGCCVEPEQDIMTEFELYSTLG